MSCIYCDFHGKCQMWDEDSTNTFENNAVGWDSEGYCVVDDDPDPSISCEIYESADTYDDEEEDYDDEYEEGNMFYNIFEAQMDLPDIDAIQAKYAKARGRKPKQFTIIKELQDDEFEDDAIYVGIALALVKTKPIWTIEDIKEELAQPYVQELIYDTYMELGDKERALRIKDDIIGNEKAFANKIHSIISMHKTKNSIFVHELSDIKIRNCYTHIANAITIFKKFIPVLQDADATELCSENRYFTYGLDSEMFMYQMIGKLFGGMYEKASNDSVALNINIFYEILSELPEDHALQQWEEPLTKIYEFCEIINKRNIYWPESDKEVRSLSAFSQYIDDVITYRAKAQKVVDSYKKKKNKAHIEIPSGNLQMDKKEQADAMSDDQVVNIVNSTVKDILRSEDKGYMLQDGRKLDFSKIDLNSNAGYRYVSIMAKDLLKQNPGLEDHMLQSTYTPVDELTGLLYSRLKHVHAKMGAPKKY